METVSGGETGGEWACAGSEKERWSGAEKSIPESWRTAGCDEPGSKREFVKYGSSCCTLALQQEWESGIAEEPQLSLICWQHSCSVSVRVSETKQAISGVPHTQTAITTAASLQVHFSITSLNVWASSRNFAAGRMTVEFLPGFRYGGCDGGHKRGREDVHGLFRNCFSAGTWLFLVGPQGQSTRSSLKLSFQPSAISDRQYRKLRPEKRDFRASTVRSPFGQMALQPLFSIKVLKGGGVRKSFDLVIGSSGDRKTLKTSTAEGGGATRASLKPTPNRDRMG